eukprot:SAG22_NODE_7818_length_705_cov_0.971947_1_plen_43_part_10
MPDAGAFDNPLSDNAESTAGVAGIALGLAGERTRSTRSRAGVG